MADLRKALVAVRIETDIRSLHKVYEALHGDYPRRVVTATDDANLSRLLRAIEQVLVRSGYMTDAELRAIRAPVFATWDVKG